MLSETIKELAIDVDDEALSYIGVSQFDRKMYAESFKKEYKKFASYEIFKK